MRFNMVTSGNALCWNLDIRVGLVRRLWRSALLQPKNHTLELNMMNPFVNLNPSAMAVNRPSATAKACLFVPSLLLLPTLLLPLLLLPLLLLQALCVATLGSDSDAQKIDSIRGDATDSTDEDAAAGAAAAASAGLERFYLQYFFPPSSVGECGRVGPAGRV